MARDQWAVASFGAIFHLFIVIFYFAIIYFADCFCFSFTVSRIQSRATARNLFRIATGSAVFGGFFRLTL